MLLRAALVLPFLIAVVRADSGYRVPLIGDYAVVREERRAMAFLAEVHSTRHSFSVHEILPKIEEVAVTGNIITGKANAQYFLLDTAQPDPTPQLFQTSEQWTDALKANGVSAPIALSTPDSLAATLPDHVLRPYGFRIMHNLFGFSDYEWAALIQYGGMLLSFVIGLLGRRRLTRVPLAIILGIAVNIIAELFLTGGGAPALVGFFCFPLIFILLAAFGALVRKRVARAVARPVEVGE